MELQQCPDLGCSCTFLLFFNPSGTAGGTVPRVEGTLGSFPPNSAWGCEPRAPSAWVPSLEVAGLARGSLRGDVSMETSLYLGI